MTTFIELVIALEIETGVHLGGPETDLARKVSLYRTGVRYLMSKCRPKTDDRACKRTVTFEDFFRQKKYVGTLEMLTDQRLPGIYRGVAWRHGLQQAAIIAACAYRAGNHYSDLIAAIHQDGSISGLHNRLPPFGEGFTPRLGKSGIGVTWRAPVLAELESQVVHAYLRNRPLGGTCHFGCVSKAKLKVQSLVPRWRGASLGSGICSNCHGCLIREMNDRTTPLITEAGHDPLHRDRLQGPCHFGCLTSAMDNSFKGRMQWHRAPSPCDWPGVEDGVTLCNACYVGFRYHAARPNGCLPRDQWARVKKRALGDATAPVLALEDAPAKRSTKILRILDDGTSKDPGQICMDSQHAACSLGPPVAETNNLIFSRTRTGTAEAAVDAAMQAIPGVTTDGWRPPEDAVTTDDNQGLLGDRSQCTDTFTALDSIPGEAAGSRALSAPDASVSGVGTADTSVGLGHRIQINDSESSNCPSGGSGDVQLDGAQTILCTDDPLVKERDDIPTIGGITHKHSDSLSGTGYAEYHREDDLEWYRCGVKISDKEKIVTSKTLPGGVRLGEEALQESGRMPRPSDSLIGPAWPNQPGEVRPDTCSASSKDPRSDAVTMAPSSLSTSVSWSQTGESTSNTGDNSECAQHAPNTVSSSRSTGSGVTLTHSYERGQTGGRSTAHIRLFDDLNLDMRRYAHKRNQLVGASGTLIMISPSKKRKIIFDEDVPISPTNPSRSGTSPNSSSVLNWCHTISSIRCASSSERPPGCCPAGH